MLREFWKDESGAVVTTEMVAVGTVALASATIGMGQVSNALFNESEELAEAIRSLDQSYTFNGHQHAGGSHAPSSYTQTPVAESITALRSMAVENAKKANVRIELQLKNVDKTAEEQPQEAPNEDRDTQEPVESKTDV